MDGESYPFRKYERKAFDAERCTACGACFSKCPVLRMPETSAEEAILSLRRHFEDEAEAPGAGAPVLARCTSCFACNLICPENCRPANLILDLWHRRYVKEGLPARARYFLPHSRPNFRTYVLDRLPDDERRAIESWKDTAPVDELFFPGCNIIAAPYLTFSSLFDGLPIRGALEYCCGEMYFRMGLYEALEQVARKCTGYFKALQVKRVYLLCTAGLNLFSHILPQYGADFSGVTFIPYFKVIHERLLSGALPIVKRFDGETVTVQDSCHGKLYEEAYYAWPRRILELIGFRVVEAEHNRQTALCCGIGGGFSHDAAYGKAALIGGQRRCMKNAAEPGAGRIAAYCAGCLEMLSAAKYVSWPRTPVYHVLELVQEAIGETPKRRQGRIAFDFTRGTLLNQSLGGARFFVPPIE